MDRISVIRHKEFEIVLADFSGLKAGVELRSAMEQCKTVIRSRPQGSVLVLSDISGGHYDQEVINAFKDLIDGNAPYVKADAIIGVGGLLGIGIMAMSRLTGKTFKVFNAREEALDWLAEQAGPRKEGQ
jgi:hypothetical protein